LPVSSEEEAPHALKLRVQPGESISAPLHLIGLLVDAHIAQAHRGVTVLGTLPGPLSLQAIPPAACYPLGSGNAAIILSMLPNSLRKPVSNQCKVEVRAHPTASD